MKELFAVDKKGNIKHWSVETQGSAVIVRHGRYLGKMQEKVTICEGKNIGKKNETSSEEQAALEAESKYKKQIDKCYRPTIEEAKTVGQVLPMLAQNFLNHGHRINWPCYVSRKLDGLRCLAKVDGDTVTFTSRGGKTYPVPEHIRKDLCDLSLSTNIKEFDGELYIHGMPLQDIVSCVKKPNPNSVRLEYHVFDIPEEGTWVERYSKLYRFVTRFSSSIRLVRSTIVANQEAAQTLLGMYMAEGYEGIMLRNNDGLYESNHRSADIQKWKIMNDLEAKVIHVDIDKLGEGILTCKTPTIPEFRCKMRGTHESRSFNEMKKLIGEWITVAYQTLTKEGVPQFPVGICVRECDENGQPVE
ncbi:ATP-dependent DNA ligase [Aeromonas phage BUCT695]|uniref:ATP-dependent DNA ligase n=1 Tax=Aeromonas phage BUCT695 TaxID=2908630 RepID=UPI0023291DBF|nr:ATP-dependent DNA ligase [Aeromonas phage BUCT695]UIW10567.1 ATP-dependent DNA ligase [Aeromonas phage BUCT695]